MPRDPVAEDLDGQWHKILAIVMKKLSITHIEITCEEIDRIASELGDAAVLADVRGGDVLRLDLMSRAQAEKIQREARLS